VAESCLIVSTGSFALLLCVRDPLLRRLILDVLSLLFRCSRNSSDNKSVRTPSYLFPPFLDMSWIFNSFLFSQETAQSVKSWHTGVESHDDDSAPKKGSKSSPPVLDSSKPQIPARNPRSTNSSSLQVVVEHEGWCCLLWLVLISLMHFGNFQHFQQV
jgi:hypothetical protein